MTFATILDQAGIDAHFALTASLDRRFAAEDRKFWESRTTDQLKNIAAQSWNCNDRTGYVLANSYLRMGA